MRTVFLHGLDSSSQGTKARWFSKHFPAMMIPDFEGVLEDRMKKLRSILAGRDEIVLIGSSFGGLMAAIYSQEHENRMKKIVLLAPALNFPDFYKYPVRRVNAPVQLYIGRQDIVCPPDIVIPIAQKIFSDLSLYITDDDHLLHQTFLEIDWTSILAPENPDNGL